MERIAKRLRSVSAQRRLGDNGIISAIIIRRVGSGRCCRHLDHELQRCWGGVSRKLTLQLIVERASAGLQPDRRAICADLEEASCRRPLYAAGFAPSRELLATSSYSRGPSTATDPQALPIEITEHELVEQAMSDFEDRVQIVFREVFDRDDSSSTTKCRQRTWKGGTR
jgi:hypothetical protein